MYRGRALNAFLLTMVFSGLLMPAWAAAQTEVAEEAVEVVDESASADAPFEMTSEWEAGYTINTLIMFLCAVLVLFMQAGFAMVEVGLNAAKNTVNILFKNLMDLCLGVLLFLFVGYGLMYPGDDYAGKWFGFGGSMVNRDAQQDDDGMWRELPGGVAR